jgi:hypothetical protein
VHYPVNKKITECFGRSGKSRLSHNPPLQNSHDTIDSMVDPPVVCGGLLR